MYRKYMFVLLILSAGLLSAQSIQSTENLVHAKLRGIGDDLATHAANKRIAASGIIGPTRPQSSFTFTSLQFPGATNTFALGINNQGHIAGAYGIPPGLRHALIIDHGQFLPLAPSSVLGSHFSQAFEINDRGQVVGIYLDDQGTQHGFLLSNDLLTNIDFPGAIATDAFGINSSGVIVGDFFDTTGTLHGFVLQDGVFAQIDVPGAVDTQAVKINAAGDIVGSWDTDINTRGHGFLLTREGRYILIDNPNAAPESTSATGMNDRGQIVGVYEDGTGTTHGFLLIGGTFTDVDFPGADFTNCRGINNAGVIVGRYQIDAHNVAFEARQIHP